MKTIRMLFAACACAAVFAILAFANNVVAIVNWWRAFLAAGGDSSGVAAHAPGFLPWLDWSAVDYSAVTTLIPALGLVCMTRALGRMLRGERLRAGDFPFFKGSDQLNVALGLFGTLWGIIVIGYFKLDTVSMADLMQCLHTALFSTLTAVVWVFMIDRPLVRPYFTRLLERAGLAETDEGDLSEAVSRLVVRLGEASDAFDARQKAFETAFDARQAELDEAFRRRLAELGDACKASLAAYEKEFEARQKEYVETFRRRIDELQASAAEARRQTDEARARAAASDAKLRAVTDALRA